MRFSPCMDQSLGQGARKVECTPRWNVAEIVERRSWGSEVKEESIWTVPKRGSGVRRVV